MKLSYRTKIHELKECFDETNNTLKGNVSNKEKRKALSDMLSTITDYLRSQDNMVNTTPLIKLMGLIEELNFGVINELTPEEVHNRPINYTNNMLMSYVSVSVTLLKLDGKSLKEAIAIANKNTGIEIDKIKRFRDDLLSNKRDREATKLYYEIIENKRLDLNNKTLLAESLLEVVSRLSD